MTTLTIGHGGEMVLPETVRDRYGLVPEAPVRIIETRHGILLVPLSDATIDVALAEELAEWQALGAESWGAFPYESDGA